MLYDFLVEKNTFAKFINFRRSKKNLVVITFPSNVNNVKYTPDGLRKEFVVIANCDVSKLLGF